MECTDNTEKNKEGIIKSIKHKIPLMINSVNKALEDLDHPKFLDVHFNKDLKDLKDGELFKIRAEEAKVFYD